MLMILNVIGVDPAEFFAELYGLPGPSTAWPMRPGNPPVDQGQGVDLRQELDKFRRLLEGLTGLLVGKQIVTSSDLRAVVEAEARGD